MIYANSTLEMPVTVGLPGLFIPVSFSSSLSFSAPLLFSFSLLFSSALLFFFSLLFSFSLLVLGKDMMQLYKTSNWQRRPLNTSSEDTG